MEYNIITDEAAYNSICEITGLERVVVNKLIEEYSNDINKVVGLLMDNIPNV